MNRQFLGWHKPLLDLAAEYLLANHTVNGRLDLQSVTLVLPGKRAMIRMEEILASEAQKMDDPAWYPPVFLTPESLPEKFYERKKPIAPEMVQWFAWIDSLEKLNETEPAALKQLLSNLPHTFDAKITFGKNLAKLHYELAAQGIDFQKVAKKCQSLGLLGEKSRWSILSSLQKFYANDDPHHPGFLDRHELWDVQAARLFAIHHQTPEERKKIVRKLKKENQQFYLVGLVDMNVLQKQILKNFSAFLTALVFAPKEDKKIQSRFDEFGCLRADAWHDAPLEIDDDNIEIVWHPEQEAEAVLRKIASLDSKFAAGGMIIGVPDKNVIPFVQERLAQSGLSSRLIEGTPVRRTNIFRFLEVLLKFAKNQHFRNYAELLRHPDLERYLRKEINKDFITQLDNYYNTFFPEMVGDEWAVHHWKGDAKQEWKYDTLPLVWQKLGELLDFPPSHISTAQKELEDWLPKIDSILERLYTGQQPVAGQEQVHTIIDIVQRTTRMMRSLPAGLFRAFTFAEMLELLLTQIESEPIAPSDAPNAIELIGWLDMAMDDAPVAIMTGMNDGIVPSYTTSDIFLPDALRKELGIMDNRRRCARDAYALTVIQETRKKRGAVLFVAARRTAEGDAKLPSRFFFMSEDTKKVAQRVYDFFTEQKSGSPVRLRRALRPGRETEHNFRPPTLPDLPEPIESFSVTELSGYLQCPYRYYLKRLLGLRKIDDSAEELPAWGFGTLIHDALQRFGEKDSPVRNSSSAKAIREFLDARLTEKTEQMFGKSPRATVAIQIERAKTRLHAFADWQADWHRSGYEIADVEYVSNGNRQVTLAEKTLIGRIDRIDRHHGKREIVVIDYKTGTTDPNKAYSKKKGEWSDFQLPLYHYLLRESGYAAAGETIRLAYLPIPADASELAPQWANWTMDEIQCGILRAEEVIREILAIDWQNVQPNILPFNEQQWDDFAAICMAGLQ